MASERQEVFLSRVVELGLEDLIPQLKTKGLTSYAKFGFGCDYNPQMADASLLVSQLLKPLCGDDEHHIPSLRRLWWEAWGVATADMRWLVPCLSSGGLLCLADSANTMDGFRKKGHKPKTILSVLGSRGGGMFRRIAPEASLFLKPHTVPCQS
jgi:hypothetical protein